MRLAGVCLGLIILLIITARSCDMNKCHDEGCILNDGHTDSHEYRYHYYPIAEVKLAHGGEENYWQECFKIALANGVNTWQAAEAADRSIIEYRKRARPAGL